MPIPVTTTRLILSSLAGPAPRTGPVPSVSDYNHQSRRFGAAAIFDLGKVQEEARRAGIAVTYKAANMDVGKMAFINNNPREIHRAFTVSISA
jgi:hypothetical protein